MRNPFENHVEGTASISLGGMVDYWVDPVLDDAADNVLDRNGSPTVGVAIIVDVAGTVAYHDRHEILRTKVLEAGQIWPTSVQRVLVSGTDATGVKVAIAP